jgi:DNA ligase (NAD+)
LYALGIRYVGETTAKSLAKHFGNIDAISAASIETLLGTEDIGQVIAESVYDFFKEESNIDTIARLKAAGLKFESSISEQKLSDKLAGKTIVISGNFSVSRDDMKALIASHGGKSSGSVSGKTSYLLAGEKPGPEKIKKAETLGVEIIDENKFREMIL